MKNSRQHSVESGSLSFPFSYRVVVDEAKCKEDVNHYHMEHEMILIGEGSYTVHLDDMKYAVHKGDLVIIPAGVSHHFEHLEIKLPIYNQDGTITTEYGTLNTIEHTFTNKEGVTTSSEQAIEHDSLCLRALEKSGNEQVDPPVLVGTFLSAKREAIQELANSEAELREVEEFKSPLQSLVEGLKDESTSAKQKHERANSAAKKKSNKAKTGEAASKVSKQVASSVSLDGLDDDTFANAKMNAAVLKSCKEDLASKQSKSGCKKSKDASKQSSNTDEQVTASELELDSLDDVQNFEPLDGQEWRWNDQKERDYKRLERLDKSDSFVYKCLYFDPNLILEHAGNGRYFIEAIQNGQIKLQSVFYRTNPDDRAVITAFDDLCHTVQSVFSLEDNSAQDDKFSKRAALELKAQGQFLTLMGILQYEQHYKNHEEQTASERRQVKLVNDAIKFIAAHYKENISLNHIAEEVKLQPTYLCRSFKEYTDKTPVEYINAMRIEEACKLLSQTDKRISSIVDELGFKDPGYFARVFKKYTGSKPSEYRSANTTIKAASPAKK
ncbi:AraC family transcriptional regulator [Anaerobiospirillum succiniciproducens]|uniref:AraC family transcriptional regulator n=1 Tax=Anaerobiospirillum succiniciproducens TaxID=13335 RepID=UPI00248DF4AB|nr:AraC family transcriptional regulator [Anaerobiospirillum succiniciproducens]